MKKILLFLLFSLAINLNGQSQYLFGFRTTNGHNGTGSYWDLVRMDLTNDSFTTLQANVWRGQNWVQHCAHYTSDKTNGRFFSKLLSASTSSIPDTLLEINISTGAIIRRAIPKNTLLFPVYYNNKIYGLSPTGIGVFDLAVNTYTQLSTAAKAGRAGNLYHNNSSIDAATGRYFFLFQKGGANDSLGIYNIATNTVVMDLFAPSSTYPAPSVNFEHLPGTDKIYFYAQYLTGGIPGYYSYDFSGGIL